MASTGRDSRASVVEALREQEYAFDFFQAVRIIESMRPDAPSVGTSSKPSTEAVRFRSDPTLAFPSSEIVAVHFPERDEDPVEVVVSFLGLAGSQGPLPVPFTELVLDRMGRGDFGPRDFLDIFNHRLVSLLYRAREKHRVGLRIQPPDEGPVADMGFSLMGLGGSRLRNRMKAKGLSDRALLHYAGFLAQEQRSATALEGMIADYFSSVLASQDHSAEELVNVREFVGRWHTLESDQGTRLGVPDGNCRLGVDAVIGGRVWDQQGMIEIVLGPLTLESFLHFLPRGAALSPLRELATFYLRGDVDFTIRIVLRAADVPGTVLTLGPEASQLGLTSWLKTRPSERDAGDVVLGPAPWWRLNPGRPSPG